MPSESVSNPTESALFSALCHTGTSNQWSLLPSVLSKLNRRLPPGTKPATEQDLLGLLGGIPAEELQTAGVWIEWCGNSALICVNRAYGATRAKEKQANAGKAAKQCACGTKAATERTDFGSCSYGAAGGRHATTQSRHLGTCPKWALAPTGHLHSWRRDFKKKQPVPEMKPSHPQRSPRTFEVNLPSLSFEGGRVLCVRACVHACVRVRVRACVRARACACVLRLMPDGSRSPTATFGTVVLL